MVQGVALKVRVVHSLRVTTLHEHPDGPNFRLLAHDRLRTAGTAHSGTDSLFVLHSMA